MNINIDNIYYTIYHSVKIFFKKNSIFNVLLLFIIKC